MNHYVNINGQKLNKYIFNTGGGMRGGHMTQTIERMDELNAVIRNEKADTYKAKPYVTKYVVDIAIMDELEAVIRKYYMNHWNYRKFTNMFIADGESKSYTFEFDNAQIYFSSQVYPFLYRNKLDKLNLVIDKYISDNNETANKDIL